MTTKDIIAERERMEQTHAEEIRREQEWFQHASAQLQNQCSHELPYRQHHPSGTCHVVCLACLRALP